MKWDNIALSAAMTFVVVAFLITFYPFLLQLIEYWILWYNRVFP